MGIPRLLLLAGCVVASGAAFSSAAPLNLVKVDPDVASGFIAIDYSSVNGLFTAVGQTQNLELTPGGGSINMGLELFSLSAILDVNGLLAGPGSLTVRGDYGGTNQLLFSSSSILAFGFSATNKFEFQFSQAAGSLASVGTTIGTILTDLNLSFPGGVPDFHSGFSNRFFPGGPGNGSADTFVPSPSAAAVGALAGLAAMRRRRR